jgi:hypothetical protein
VVVGLRLGLGVDGACGYRVSRQVRTCVSFMCEGEGDLAADAARGANYEGDFLVGGRHLDGTLNNGRMENGCCLIVNVPEAGISVRFQSLVDISWKFDPSSAFYLLSISLSSKSGVCTCKQSQRGLLITYRGC